MELYVYVIQRLATLRELSSPIQFAFDAKIGCQCTIPLQYISPSNVDVTYGILTISTLTFKTGCNRLLNNLLPVLNQLRSWRCLHGDFDPEAGNFLPIEFLRTFCAGLLYV